MKICAILLSFLLAFSPMTVLAEESVEVSVPEFDAVTGDTSDMHREIKTVIGTGTTLENCAPGKLKFHSIKGKTYQETTSGKNCIPISEYVTKESGSHSQYMDIPILEKGVTYILSGSSTDGIPLSSYNCQIVWSQETKSQLFQSNDAMWKKGRVVDVDLSQATSFHIFTTSELAGKTIRIQLEKGTIATEYEPFTNGVTPNPLYPQKYESVLFDKIKVYNNNGEQNEVDFITSTFLLNGIGNVCDEITDSKFIQRIGEIVFDGSDDEEWALGTTSSGKYRLQISIPVKPATNVNKKANILCDSYVVTTAGENYMEHEGIAVTTINLLYIYDKDFNSSTSVAAWKSRLAENPISVLYELDEPIETDLSQTDKFNFSWLDTYEGTNYISFVGSPLVPDIEVEFLAYFEKIYDSSLQAFTKFMGTIFEFVATEFTIWGFTFSYWQIIVLSCLAGMVGYFIHRALGG